MSMRRTNAAGNVVGVLGIFPANAVHPARTCRPAQE